MPTLAEATQSMDASVAQLREASAGLSGATDDELLGALAWVAQPSRELETFIARIAGEVAARSGRELGYSGLAQRGGFITPAAMVQAVSGITRQEAGKLTRVGGLMVQAERADGADGAGPVGATEPVGGSDDPQSEPGAVSTPVCDDSSGSGEPGVGLAPWQVLVARAVASGALSVDAAESIRRGLGDVGGTADAGAAERGVERLLANAARVGPDDLYRGARTLRDELEAEGVARHEVDQYERRFLHVWRVEDGMYRVNGLLDAEGGRLVASAVDAVLAPRRGGPRFVDPGEQARRDAVMDDTRTNEQLTADAVVEMVRIAGDADEGRVFGLQRPAVRVVVTEEVLRTRRGAAILEGHDDSVSLATAERHLCDAGSVPIVLDDDGQCVNVGRRSRLFTPKQRIGLAVRDGGCLWPGCDRPPSWCEAHHIDEWLRDHGRTDIADGVLLCRHHHLLLHNNEWRIVREGARYGLKPPRALDPNQTLRPMSSKSPLMRTLYPARRAG